MSQEYLYAVQRAELLGQVAPSEEEWAASNAIKSTITEDEVDDPAAEELEQADESATRIGGGLDELNSILSATQRKINRFKTVCGSLGSLLKVRMTSREGTPEHKPSASLDDSEKITEETTLNADSENDSEPCVLESKPIQHKKIDMNEKMGSHLDKLDSLISKAERAQGSMEHQTKQMKKILHK